MTYNENELATRGAIAPVMMPGQPAELAPWSAAPPLAAGETAPAEGRPRISLAVLARYKWSMLLIFVLLAAPTTPLAWLLVAPQYRARAIVEVSPVIPRVVFERDDRGVIPLYQQYLSTQVELLASPAVLKRTVEQEEVRNTKWYQQPPRPLLGGPSSAVERLESDLSVRSQRGTQVIEVQFVGADPRDAAVVVNAVVSQYAQYAAESARATDDQLYRELLREFDSRRATIEGLARQRADHLRAMNTAQPEQLLSEQRLRLDQLETQRESLRREILLVEWQLGDVDAASSPPAELSVEHARYEQDTTWRGLWLELRDAQGREDAARLRLGAAHPRMAELRGAVELAEQRMRDYQALLDRQPLAADAVGRGQTVAASPEALAEQLRRLRFQDELLTRDIEVHRAEVDATVASAAELAKLDDELRHQRELFEAVRTRKTHREIESGAPGAISVRATALPPTKPSNQRRRFGLLALAACGSLVAALGTGYVRASTSRRVQRADDVEAATRKPILGYLPWVRDPSKIGPVERALRSEAVRMVRTAILERIAGEDGTRRGPAGTDGRVLLVTSAGSGAGKTTTALLLARSLAQCGRRVLLVDADLRNPSLSSGSHMAGRPGLLDVLRAPEGSRAIVRLEGDTLDLLAAGTAYRVEDSELLTNGRFAACLARWRAEYDLVILDSPPLLAVADARILANQVDGYVLVVRDDHCQRADVNSALACLSGVRGEFVGVIFMGAPRHHEYYSSVYWDDARSPRSAALAPEVPPAE